MALIIFKLISLFMHNTHFEYILVISDLLNFSVNSEKSEISSLKKFYFLSDRFLVSDTS